MPTIECTLEGFGSARTPSQSVSVSLLDLLFTAATVGMPTLASHPGSARPLLEMQWRMAMVAAYLRITDGGTRWTRSDAYDRLDPSEKISVSYFLGMTQAALMSQLALGYPHLVHVDLLLAQQGVPLKGKRPDFVAVNPTAPRRYSATVEAKGRTNRFDQDALDKAKQQATLIPAVNGLVPRETVGSEAYFDDSEHWTSHLVDPDWEGETLSFGLETYLLVYYRTIIDAGRESSTWNRADDEYQFVVPGFPLQLQIPATMVDAYDRSARYGTNDERDREAPIVRAHAALTAQNRPDQNPTPAVDNPDSAPSPLTGAPTVSPADEAVPASSFITMEPVDDEAVLTLFEKG
ncbi:hypothetical protein ACTHQN_07440 [Curtobacterium flaccumfaciens]|uniref:hypothetical protein n=1 Tax=Curtobacterium flaccumfaciens TaxID=2035 RepID=UPI003F7EDFDB